MEEEHHGEEKEEEIEIEDLKRASLWGNAIRSFGSNYALAAERSSAAFALAEGFVAVAIHAPRLW
jgi:hypothetical protein